MRSPHLPAMAPALAPTMAPCRPATVAAPGFPRGADAGPAFPRAVLAVRAAVPLRAGSSLRAGAVLRAGTFPRAAA